MFLNKEVNDSTSVVLYAEDQSIDVLSFVNSESDHLIDVDLIFNIGACFVTTTVYKNLKVVQKKPTMNIPYF